MLIAFLIKDAKSQSLKENGKSDRNHNCRYSRKTSVSSVSKERTKPKFLKWNLQTKKVSRQTGWRNAAVSFRKPFRKRASTNHNRKYRQFRPPKSFSKRAKFKICEEKPTCKKIYISELKEEMLSKVFRKLNLKIETSHTIMQSFYSPVHLASVRKKETQKVMVEKNFLIEFKISPGCVGVQKLRSNTKKNHTQDGIRRTKGIFLDLWIEKRVLKDNGYNKEGSYLYSGQYSLLSSLLAKWVSLAITDWKYLINLLKRNRKFVDWHLGRS